MDFWSFQPKFQPPTGTTIKITLEYPLRLAPDPKQKGKFVRVTGAKETTRVRAQRWVRGSKTKKDLDKAPALQKRDSNWVLNVSQDVTIDGKKKAVLGIGLTLIGFSPAA